MDVNGFRQRLLLAIVPRLYALVTKVLFSTYRVEVIGQQNFDQLYSSGRPFIAAIWHYSVLYALSYMKGKNWVAMVSTSSDAEFISRYLTNRGMTTVRGSRNTGSFGALRALLVQVKRYGKHAAIAADGSQGPAMKAQPGVILAASRTQAPILPLVWAAQRYWAFQSWDKTVIPKPFSRVRVVFGEPITIPAKINAEEIDRQTLALEERLSSLYTEAWGVFGVKGHGVRGEG